jgi:hypothetical protein
LKNVFGFSQGFIKSGLLGRTCNHTRVITRCDFVAYGQGMQKTLQRFFM